MSYRVQEHEMRVQISSSATTVLLLVFNSRRINDLSIVMISDNNYDRTLAKINKGVLQVPIYDVSVEHVLSRNTLFTHAFVYAW